MDRAGIPLPFAADPRHCRCSPRAHSRPSDMFVLEPLRTTPMQETPMQERSISRAPAHQVITLPKREAPLLLCFSHLRWDFVWQRPQHLLSRAAKHYRVVQFEEPRFEKGILPRLDLSTRAGGVTVAVPVLPEGLTAPDGLLALRGLVDRLLAREADGPRVL